MHRFRMESNRHERRKRDAIARGELKIGVFTSMPEHVRYSTTLRALRRTGFDEAKIAEFENDKATQGSTCPVHGELDDPVLGILGSGKEARVAFACPWCSGEAILALWEREGLLS